LFSRACRKIVKGLQENRLSISQLSRVLGKGLCTHSYRKGDKLGPQRSGPRETADREHWNLVDRILVRSRIHERTISLRFLGVTLSNQLVSWIRKSELRIRSVRNILILTILSKIQRSILEKMFKILKFEWFFTYLATYFFQWPQNCQGRSGSGINWPLESGSIFQDYGSANPGLESWEIFMDTEHCLKVLWLESTCRPW
jgi:hypothetical protein